MVVGSNPAAPTNAFAGVWFQLQPVLKKLHVNGVELAYFEWGAPQANRPALLFLHATGFHGRVWDCIIESLPGQHALALEQRGHGRSEKAAIAHWRVFGEDLAGFVGALGLRQLIGIGHSMGGHALIEGAARSGAFSRLLLLDPTVAAPAAYRKGISIWFGDGPHPASKRRSRFASPQEMRRRIAGKGSFPHFEPRILEDYCLHGLLPDESGGYRLACPPEIEASIYMGSLSNGAVYDSLRTLDIPVTLVRAQPRPPNIAHSFASSPTWPELAKEFPQARDLHWADCSHFIPMQRPAAVADLIREEIRHWRQSPAAPGDG